MTMTGTRVVLVQYYFLTLCNVSASLFQVMSSCVLLEHGAASSSSAGTHCATPEHLIGQRRCDVISDITTALRSPPPPHPLPAEQ